MSNIELEQNAIEFIDFNEEMHFLELDWLSQISNSLFNRQMFWFQLLFN